MLPASFRTPSAALLALLITGSLFLFTTALHHRLTSSRLAAFLPLDTFIALQTTTSNDSFPSAASFLAALPHTEDFSLPPLASAVLPLAPTHALLALTGETFRPDNLLIVARPIEGDALTAALTPLLIPGDSFTATPSYSTTLFTANTTSLAYALLGDTLIASPKASLVERSLAAYHHAAPRLADTTAYGAGATYLPPSGFSAYLSSDALTTLISRHLPADTGAYALLAARSTTSLHARLHIANGIPLLTGILPFTQEYARKDLSGSSALSAFPLLPPLPTGAPCALPDSITSVVLPLSSPTLPLPLTALRSSCVEARIQPEGVYFSLTFTP